MRQRTGGTLAVSTATRAPRAATASDAPGHETRAPVCRLPGVEGESADPTEAACRGVRLPAQSGTGSLTSAPAWATAAGMSPLRGRNGATRHAQPHLAIIARAHDQGIRDWIVLQLPFKLTVVEPQPITTFQVRLGLGIPGSVQTRGPLDGRIVDVASSKSAALRSSTPHW